MASLCCVRLTATAPSSCTAELQTLSWYRLTTCSTVHTPTWCTAVKIVHLEGFSSHVLPTAGSRLLSLELALEAVSNMCFAVNQVPFRQASWQHSLFTFTTLLNFCHTQPAFECEQHLHLSTCPYRPPHEAQLHALCFRKYIAHVLPNRTNTGH